MTLELKYPFFLHACNIFQIIVRKTTTERQFLVKKMVKQEVVKLHPVLQALKEFDEGLSGSLYLSATASSPCGFLRPYLKLLELSCHGIPWLGGCVLLIWFASSDDAQAFFLNVLIALLVDIIAVGIVKAAARRRRPGLNKMDMFATLAVDKLSFPSGHCTRAIMLWYIVSYKTPTPSLFLWIFKIWCICVCISRVLLARHHVGDVVGGIVQGILTYYFVSLIWLDTGFAMGVLSVFSSHTDL